MRFRIAAGREHLFVATSDADRTLVLQRNRFTALRRAPVLAGLVDKLVALPGSAAVFLDDGSLWILQDDGWRRGADLPVRAVPHVLAAHEPSGVLYALVESRVAATLPSYAPNSPPEKWQTFTPRYQAGATLARYEAQRWSAIAECPKGLDAQAGRCALIPVADGVLLLWTIAEGQIVSFHMQPADGQWRTGQITLTAEGLRRFWTLDDGGLPTILLLTETAGQKQLRAMRWVNSGAWPAPPDLRPAELQRGAAPEGALLDDLAGVCAFNDHIGLLWNSAGGAHLQFGRVGGPALEPAVDLRATIAELESGTARLELAQWLLLLFMVGVLAAMFLLRPPGLTRELALPAGMRTALSLQRLGAVIADLGPFAVVWAFVIQVNVQEAIQVLLQWRVSGQTPVRDALLWWSATALSYTLYTLTMELSVRRTAGKALMGLRVVSDKGRRAGAVQILIRNLVRLIELAPPFWILTLLVVLSPNRQRLGDLFARTLVVRWQQPTDSAGDETGAGKTAPDTPSDGPTVAPGDNIGIDPHGESDSEPKR